VSCGPSPRAANFDYVRAAKALGVGDVTIMSGTCFPTPMVATITYLPSSWNGSDHDPDVSGFPGIRPSPAAPSLGELLLQGKTNLPAPWLGITAFAIIARC